MLVMYRGFARTRRLREKNPSHKGHSPKDEAGSDATYVFQCPVDDVELLYPSTLFGIYSPPV